MESRIRVGLASVFVADQAHALRFYTETLGFAKKTDLPVGEYRFLTVTAPGGPVEIELLLEPNSHPAAAAFQRAIHADGIPATVFFVPDVRAEHARLREFGVEFTGDPTETEFGWMAVFDDTCGNLIQLQQG